MKILVFAIVCLVCCQGDCLAQEQRVVQAPRVRVTGVSMSADGFYRVGPDPNSDWELLQFLSDESEVATYIGATDERAKELSNLLDVARENEAKVFRDLRAAGRGTEVTEAILSSREEVAKTMDELLTPEQLQKLRLVAMRVEVIRMGLPLSFTHGRLAEAIGVYEGQKTDLLRKARQIELRTQAKIVALLKEAENESLELLTPEQREKAKRVLGETHDFVESPRARKLLKQLMEQTVGGP